MTTVGMSAEVMNDEKYASGMHLSDNDYQLVCFLHCSQSKLLAKVLHISV